MSYIEKVKRGNVTYHYLTEEYKENGKWKKKRIERLGTIPPIKYKPLILIGNAEDKMKQIPHKSIGLVVTSPPYWNLKDYGIDGQLGFGEGYNDYIQKLKNVWTQCHRVLDYGSRLCINIGDQFTRTTEFGRHKVIPIHSSIIQSCEDIGFDFMGSIIWQKVSTTNTTGGASVMGSYPYPKQGLVEYDYEYILIFKKLGEHKKVDKSIKLASKLTKEEWRKYFISHWNFAGVKQKSHIAMFPLKLPYRLVRMFSFKGETVLDPFVGSGTTLVASMRAGRKSIGIEINKEYIGVINKNIDNEVEKTSKGYEWEDTLIGDL